ncbi:MAG: type I restriction enzyme HsdR N-terminal domain-containing protein [Bacteroidota bacterium]
MQQLNFPKFEFRFKSTENRIQIFDIIRKKFVVLHPEEWVRQHVIHYLISVKKYPKQHINVEKQLLINGLQKRYDVIVLTTSGKIRILVECKAPGIRLDQDTFDQIARYNLKAAADYMMVTNGIHHIFCQIDHNNEKYTFLPEIPDFSR